MTVTTVAPSPHGSKSLTTARVVPLLGPTIDHLAELRDLIRRAPAEERKMTADVIRAMEGAGVERLEGGAAVATLLGLTQQALAEKLGIPCATLDGYETGRRRIPNTVASRLKELSTPTPSGASRDAARSEDAQCTARK